MRMPRLPRRDDSGAVAIIVAACLVGLVVVAAMVLDFGMARLDRQLNKSSADASVTAGMRGLDGGTGQVYSFRGVCTALDYLRSNDPELSTLSYAPCSDPAKAGIVCDPSNSTTWAHHRQTVGNYEVRVEIPHVLDSSEFPEENLPPLAGDQGSDAMVGCDQLGVIITESRTPGLGSVATSSELVTTIRSVGRVAPEDDGQGAVALLLLEREACNAIAVNDTGAGVHVLGSGEMPGMIHSDSLAKVGATDCTARPGLYSQTDEGIVAFESEIEPKKPGLISIRALSGEAGANPANAHSPWPKVVAKPDPGTPIGRGLVKRTPVDNRYLEGVRTAMQEATSVFSSPPAPAPDVTWETGCTGGGPSAATLAQTGTVVFDCPLVRYNSDVTLVASRVIMRGQLQVPSTGGAALRLPNADRLYVRGYDPATMTGQTFGIDVRGTLEVHTLGHTDASGWCTESNHPSRGRVVVGGGAFEASSSASLARMCHTTLLMMGNNFSSTTPGCLPATVGEEPARNTCDGFVNLVGGNGPGNGQDLTAPDAMAEIPAGEGPLHWSQLEDLALWTEAEDSSSNTQHRIGGGGGMHLAGVFALMNADAFRLSGGASQDMLNSQYIARRLEVRGGSKMIMQPDPHDVVTIPILGGFNLVR